MDHPVPHFSNFIGRLCDSAPFIFLLHRTSSSDFLDFFLISINSVPFNPAHRLAAASLHHLTAIHRRSQPPLLYNHLPTLTQSLDTLTSVDTNPPLGTIMTPSPPRVTIYTTLNSTTTSHHHHHPHSWTGRLRGMVTLNSTTTSHCRHIASWAGPGRADAQGCAVAPGAVDF
jgi:hypothetical protein